MQGIELLVVDSSIASDMLLLGHGIYANNASARLHDGCVVELHHEPTLFWCKHSVLLLVTLSHHRRCAADILHRAVRGEADLDRRNLRDQAQAGLPPRFFPPTAPTALLQ